MWSTSTYDHTIDWCKSILRSQRDKDSETYHFRGDRVYPNQSGFWNLAEDLLDGSLERWPNQAGAETGLKGLGLMSH